MNKLIDRLGLGAKLLLAPGAALLLMVALALGAFWSMRSQQATLTDLVEVRTPNLMAALELEQQAKSLHAGLYQFLSWKTATYSAERTEKLGKSLLVAAGKLKGDVHKMAGRDNLEAMEQEILKRMVTPSDEFTKAVPEIIDMSDADQSVATTMMLKAETPFGALIKDVDALKLSQVAQNSAAAKASAESFGKSTVFGLVALAVCALFSGLVTWLVGGSILKSVKAISEAASRLREGDLRSAVSVQGSDEVAKTARAMSDTVASLRQTIGSINQAVYQIDQAV
jgi:methyl-accepting chemotaxis protein